MRRDFRQHGLDALHGEHGAATALFQRGDVGANFARQLRGLVAALAQRLQAALRRLHLGFQRALLLFVLEQLALLRGDEVLALAMLFADALQFALVGGEPLAHARHLAFELAQRVLGGHGLPLGLALLVFQPLQQAGQFGDLAAQRGDAGFLLAHGAFQFAHLEQHVAQFALHRERTLAALLAAGDGHVVEALARLREEERVGIFQRQLAADFGVGNDVAVAQLGQNHFQRLAEAIEHANAVLQRNHGVAVRDVIASTSSKSKENFACESSGCTRNVARPSTSVRSRRRPSSAASHDFTTM